MSFFLSKRIFYQDTSDNIISIHKIKIYPHLFSRSNVKYIFIFIPQHYTSADYECQMQRLSLTFFLTASNALIYFGYGALHEEVYSSP